MDDVVELVELCGWKYILMIKPPGDKASHLLVVITALWIVDSLPEERHSLALQRMSPVSSLSIVIDIIFSLVSQSVVDRPAMWKRQLINWLLVYY